MIGRVNSGGGSAAFSRLPREYQAVEYLESTGTQGFLTGLYFKTYMTIHIEFMWTALTADTDIIGVEGGSNGFAILVNHFNGKNRLIVKVDSANNSSQSYAANTRYNTDIIGWQTGTNVFINGEQWNYIGNTTTTPNQLQLFGRNHNGTLGSFPSCRIYNCTIRDAGTLVRDFVPCYRKSDSVAGMYDLVNDVFYTNEGTGSFVVGNDV